MVEAREVIPTAENAEEGAAANGIISNDLQERAETAAGTPEHQPPGSVQRSEGGPADEPVETDAQRIQRLRREAYSTATTRLREEHRDLFNGIMSEECERRGISWSPRLDEEGKALQTVRELLEKFPSLAGRIKGVVPE